MDFYIQKFGKKRIVSVISYRKDRAILEDVKTNLRYAMQWDSIQTVL